MRYEVTLEDIHCKLLCGEIIYNYLYPNHSNIDNINMYVMHIHLPDRHYNVSHFHAQLVDEIVAQAFVSEQRLPRLSMSCPFWAVSRPYGSR